MAANSDGLREAKFRPAIKEMFAPIETGKLAQQILHDRWEERNSGYADLVGCDKATVGRQFAGSKVDFYACKPRWLPIIEDPELTISLVRDAMRQRYQSLPKKLTEEEAAHKLERAVASDFNFHEPAAAELLCAQVLCAAGPSRRQVAEAVSIYGNTLSGRLVQDYVAAREAWRCAIDLRADPADSDSQPALTSRWVYNTMNSLAFAKMILEPRKAINIVSDFMDVASSEDAIDFQKGYATLFAEHTSICLSPGSFDDLSPGALSRSIRRLQGASFGADGVRSYMRCRRDALVALAEVLKAQVSCSYTMERDALEELVTASFEILRRAIVTAQDAEWHEHIASLWVYSAYAKAACPDRFGASEVEADLKQAGRAANGWLHSKKFVAIMKEKIMSMRMAIAGEEVRTSPSRPPRAAVLGVCLFLLFLLGAPSGSTAAFAPTVGEKASRVIAGILEVPSALAQEDQGCQSR